ncbi:MAG: 4Fe-4S binding protein [Clostridia bacterium]|nr:4Fe-4S binding protein [Clostridia bacterium]
MKVAVINESKCDRSPFCPVKRICPVGAVTQEGGFFRSKAPKIDKQKCIGCNKCVRVCPMGAVSMQ